jgi:hypothetical protein
MRGGGASLRVDVATGAPVDGGGTVLRTLSGYDRSGCGDSSHGLFRHEFQLVGVVAVANIVGAISLPTAKKV